MSTPRVIKRYTNRKLYDTKHSRYIKLDEIALMIKEGQDIQIIDNKTKADLTAVTMAQILVEEEKRQKRASGLPTLRSLIQQSGTLISRRIGEPVTHMRASVEESVTRLIKTGEERAVETRESLQAWFDSNTAALEDLQHRVDERVRQAASTLDPFAGRRQLDELLERIERIENHLKLEKWTPSTPSTESETASTEPVESV